MKIISDIENLEPSARDAVIVIGNFDGVHKGHQALLEKGAGIAKAQNKKLAVLTFEPHPRKLFRPDEAPNRITPPDLKAQRLAAHGVDILFTPEFNWDFASQSAEDFIEKILKSALVAAHVIVGYNFCFGQMRKGTPQMIEESGLNIDVVEQIKDPQNETLSSTAIRRCLRDGEIDKANAALGWDWEMRGAVVKGDQRGRELGYPTANVPLDDMVHPAYGIYATWARIEGEDIWRPSATNIGIRPMFEIPTAQIETFIFDFDREIYGEVLHVKPVKRLRSEAKFNSLDDLITQMAKDCAQASMLLES